MPSACATRVHAVSFFSLFSFIDYTNVFCLTVLQFKFNYTGELLEQSVSVCRLTNEAEKLPRFLPLYITAVFLAAHFDLTRSCHYKCGNLQQSVLVHFTVQTCEHANAQLNYSPSLSFAA